MIPRRLGISEARRLLPQIVADVGRHGGRVDITHRGEPKVSILRVSDVRRPAGEATRSDPVPPAARIELQTPEDLVVLIRGLRSRQNVPRRDWLTTEDSDVAAGGRRRRKARR